MLPSAEAGDEGRMQACSASRSAAARGGRASRRLLASFDRHDLVAVVTAP